LAADAAKEYFFNAYFAHFAKQNEQNTRLKKSMRLCKKYFAAYGGKIKFFRAAFSTILRSKIVENAALKKYYLAA
jgi:hypothetical protein